MRAALSLFLLLCLAACGVFDIKQKVAPTVVPPERIALLVSLLNDEWVRWGSATVLIDRLPDGTCLLLPDGNCVNVDVGCGQEQAPLLCPVVNEFWVTAGSPPRNACVHVGVCDITRPPDAPYHANAPWSAAFVSTMMARAGFSPTEFSREISHAAYIVAARDGYASSYDVVPTPVHVLPGDLVCAGRGQNLVTPSDLHRVTTVQFPMHCDVVVQVDAAARRAEAVGGNVQQTVAKTIVLLDEQGRVAFDATSPRAWAFVMKARKGAVGP